MKSPRLFIVMTTILLLLAACRSQPEATATIPPLPLVTSAPASTETNAEADGPIVVEEPAESAELAEPAESADSADVIESEESTDAPSPTVVPSSSALLTPSRCPFDTSFYASECGTAIVTETRDPAFADDTNTIELSYAVIKSESPTPAADPLIYLEGGPGGDTMSSLDWFLIDYMSIFLAERDVIFISHRGSAGSTPHLDCPELPDITYQYLDQPPETYDTYDAEYLAAIMACRDALIADGANLASYNSAETASDIKELMLALGYEQASFYGASYGTRLALTIMRDHPEIVRSAVIDAIVPLEKTLEPAIFTSTERAFEHLFTACATDAACNAAYPNLRTVFYETVDQLNANPILIEDAFDRYTGAWRDVIFTGDTLMSTLFGSLYSDFQIVDLPQAIYDARDGVYEVFIDELFFDAFSSEMLFSEIQHYTTICYEDAVFDTAADFETALNSIEPRIAKYYRNATPYNEVCNDLIDRTANKIENQAVVSDIPTLILSGSFDPITPPAYAEMVAANLSNSTHINFPTLSHGVLSNACPEGIILDFLSDPTATINSDCVAEMPPISYAIKVVLSDVVLEPYENSALGIRGIAPVGWNEIEPGLLSPASDVPPGLAYRVVDSVDDYFERIIVRYYGYGVLPEPLDVIENNGLTWRTYRLNDPNEVAYPYFAIARNEDGSGHIIVTLGRSEAERQLLFDQLFYQAIAAYTVISADLEQGTSPGGGSLGDSIYPDAGNGGYDVTHYTLDLDVDVENNLLDATATIEATATQLLTAFNLDLRGLTVESATVNGVAATFGRNRDELTILPATPLASDTPFTVVIDYGGSPQPIANPATSFADVGWTPFADGIHVANVSSGAKSWYPSNNHPTDKATFTFRITADDGYTIAATGLRISETHSDGRTTAVWEMSDPMATYLAAIYIGEYVREESEGPNGLLIRNYFPPDFSQSERAGFDQTADIIAFYNDLLGPYPFDVYGSIVVDGELGFALENQTLSIHGRDATDLYVVAHEIMHQWTGNNVSLGDWQDIWLNEGFAFYLPFLYLDETGQMEIGQLMTRLYNDLEERQTVGAATVEVGDLFDYASVYLRGGMTLYALHELVGDDQFRTILQTYYATYAGGSARSADFIAVAEAVSGPAAADLLNEWLYQDALPALP